VDQDLIAVVFPGQGCQKAGMGKDFHDQHSEARAVFDEASDAIGVDLRRLCFDGRAGDDEQLDQTEYTQPCILTVEIAMIRVLRAQFGLLDGLWGGHSLGEYSALVAAGVIPLADAVRLVRARGRLMQAAVPVGQGAMLALLGDSLDLPTVGAALGGLEVDIANLNSVDQVVLSGRSEHLSAAAARLEEALPDVRRVPLQVSAPFHSRMMAPIEAGFRTLLTESAGRWDATAADHVLSNSDGGFHTPDAASVVDALTRQISGSVRWVDNMRTLLAAAPRQVYEVGPGRPLRAFFRTIDADVTGLVSLRTAQKALAPGAASSPLD
jgi:[acyl-carrier-protein] S-malonyltransferase